MLVAIGNGRYMNPDRVDGVNDPNGYGTVLLALIISGITYSNIPAPHADVIRAVLGYLNDTTATTNSVSLPIAQRTTP